MKWTISSSVQSGACCLQLFVRRWTTSSSTAPKLLNAWWTAADDVSFPKISVPIKDVVWRTTVDMSDSATVSVVRLTAVDMSARATVDPSRLGTVDSSICIKDMAALLKPQPAYDIVKGIKDACGQDVRVQVHVHSTTGVTLVSLMKAIEAGADCVDTAIS